MLLKLAPQDLQFVEQFLLTSGSLKEMAKKLNISYPTVRNRLNNIIESLEQMAKAQKSEREKVLTDLERGAISAKEAAKRLREI
jgi:hypothetical protein